MSRDRSLLEELALYEGLRRGSYRAFRRLLELHGAAMLRVAGWYLPDGVEARRLVTWTWVTALDGLSMFTWHSTFRAWLFGILVAGGRARTTIRPGAPPEILPAATGRLDWEALPWSPRWSAASWQTLQAGIAALPLAEQEALRLRDIAGWPSREVCDVLGLTQSEERRLLGRARGTLLDRLERHLGAAPSGPEVDRRTGGVAPPEPETDRRTRDAAPPEPETDRRTRDAATPEPETDPRTRDAAPPEAEAEVERRTRGLIAALRLLAPADEAAPPDPELRAAFRRWRAARGLRFPRRLLRA